MVDIQTKIALSAEEDECDPALDARGARILEQVANLQEEVVNARDSTYVLSEEEIASIDSESQSHSQSRASGVLDEVAAAQERVEAFVEAARGLAAGLEGSGRVREVEERQEKVDGEDEGHEAETKKEAGTKKALETKEEVETEEAAERNGDAEKQDEDDGRKEIDQKEPDDGKSPTASEVPKAPKGMLSSKHQAYQTITNYSHV